MLNFIKRLLGFKKEVVVEVVGRECRCKKETIITNSADIVQPTEAAAIEPPVKKKRNAPRSRKYVVKEKQPLDAVSPTLKKPVRSKKV